MPSSERSQRIAEQHDRDVTRIASVAYDPMGSIGVQVRTAVLRALRKGNSTDAAIERALKPIVPLLARAMTAASVMGQYRAQVAARKRRQPINLARIDDPLGRWREIVAFANKRVDISKATLGTLFEGFESDATTAMKSMGGLLETKVRSAVAKGVDQGLHYGGMEQLVREAFDKAGMTNAHPWLLETQTRTQTQIAYSAGRLMANEDEAIQEILYGYEYCTIGDDRVRPSHAALDGLRLPKEDPRWREIMPPNGYNCRCSVVEIFHGDGTASPKYVPDYVNVGGERVRAGADDGFDFSPLDIARSQLAEIG